MASGKAEENKTTCTLREQIVVNAAHAHPSVVKKHLLYFNPKTIKPEEIFDVTMIEDHLEIEMRFQVILTWRDAGALEVLQFTELKGSAEEALMSMLEDVGGMAFKELTSEK